MHKILTLLAIILLASGLYGQQLPYHSQYMFDNYLINPAAAGSMDHAPVLLSFRNQWTGFTDAPVTMTLSSHGKIRDKVRIGGIIFNDKTGPTGRSGAVLSYAHHMPLGDSKIAFGLSGIIFQYLLDKSALTTDEPGDNAIQGETIKKIVPEAALGLYYYGKNYYAGFSIPQLIQMKVDVGGSRTLNKMVRHYFLNAGYKFELSDEFAIEPSFMLKYIVAAPLQADINAKIHYKKAIWLGLSYRTQEAVVVMLGVRKNNFRIGYSYDITLTNIKKYSTGSHEIFIGYNLGVKKESHGLID